jgi:hypothetical protein
MKPPWTGGDAERRAGHRYKVTCRVDLLRQGLLRVKAKVSDLSAGGCFVESGEAVREGDVVKLLFGVRGVGDLTVWGDVTRVGRDGFGLRFTAFSRGGAPALLASVLAGGGCRD